MQEARAVFQVDTPVRRVFEFLSNLERIGKCIAGVKEVTLIGPQSSRWKIEVRAGVIAQVVTLDVQILEIKAPNRIQFVGKGRNVDLVGALDIREIGANSTEVSFNATVYSKGSLAPIIEIVMGHTAENLTRQSVERIKLALVDNSST